MSEDCHGKSSECNSNGIIWEIEKTNEKLDKIIELLQNPHLQLVHLPYDVQPATWVQKTESLFKHFHPENYRDYSASQNESKADKDLC